MLIGLFLLLPLIVIPSSSPPTTRIPDYVYLPYGLLLLLPAGVACGRAGYGLVVVVIVTPTVIWLGLFIADPRCLRCCYYTLLPNLLFPALPIVCCCNLLTIGWFLLGRRPGPLQFCQHPVVPGYSHDYWFCCDSCGCVIDHYGWRTHYPYVTVNPLHYPVPDLVVDWTTPTLLRLIGDHYWRPSIYFDLPDALPVLDLTVVNFPIYHANPLLIVIIMPGIEDRQFHWFPGWFYRTFITLLALLYCGWLMTPVFTKTPLSLEGMVFWRTSSLLWFSLLLLDDLNQWLDIVVIVVYYWLFVGPTPAVVSDWTPLLFLLTFPNRWHWFWTTGVCGN